MPQSDSQAPHHRHQRDFLLFRVAGYEFLVHPPGLGIMTHMHPTGLAQDLPQARGPLPADMAFTIVLLTTLMTGGRQTHEFTDLTTAAKPARVSDFGPIDHR